jgi:fructose-1,6-bisphosphatase/inositol monophosphatase family enzyme
MDSVVLAQTLRQTAGAVFDALAAFEGRGASGQRDGQYSLDLVADDAACAVLLGAGLGVFSEESGRRGGDDIIVVVDPVDGSTNCDRGVPFYSISLCALDASGPYVSLVENLATRDVFEAIRGRGATKNGKAIRTSGATTTRGAVIAANGMLSGRPPWGQVRTMGSSALELCLVADGSLDGYTQVSGAAIHPWDYLAGLQIVQEAGGAVRSIDGEELVIVENVPRRPLVGATQVLADQLLCDSEELG